MKRLSLDVMNRPEKGSTASRRMRRMGRIPAVIYGDSGTRPLSVDKGAFLQLWKTVEGGVALFDIKDDQGAKSTTIVSSPERHPATDDILCLDFKEINDKKEFYVDLPIQLEGEAHGVKIEGGIIDIVSHKVNLKCLLKHLPEAISIDITDLKLGEAVHIKDLPKIEGVTFTGEANQVVVACVGNQDESEEGEGTEGASAAA